MIIICICDLLRGKGPFEPFQVMMYVLYNVFVHVHSVVLCVMYIVCTIVYQHIKRKLSIENVGTFHHTTIYQK